MENRNSEIANRAVDESKDKISEVSGVKAGKENHTYDGYCLSDIEMKYIDLVLMNEEKFNYYLHSYRNSENEEFFRKLANNRKKY